jgi:pyrroloquinoline quinone (PQQ) biosynthesis protein C
MALWTLNRRDCWAFAQALAPFEVKRMIWKHEEDELDGNKERGVEDHFALQIQQGELLNLKPEDFHDARMTAATRTCTYAWIHLVKDSHWLKAVSACCALEISNSSEWVDGGGGSYRMGLAQEKELGIPFEKQVDNKEHTEVEVEHAHMLIQIAERYGTTKEALNLMLEGLIESWEISTIWKGLLADMMEAIPAR